MKKLGMITLGGLIQGFAMGVFLFPNDIPSGGAGGLAVLLNFFFSVPISFALWLVNFSLLVVAIKGLGNASALGTMFAISITSLGINLFSQEVYLPFSNSWIDLLLGAPILGLGVGVLMRQGVSNGGIGVLALIYAKKRERSPGKALFWMNGTIFFITAAIIDWNLIIQALSCQWISSRVVDYTYNVKVSPHLFPQFVLRRKK